MGQAGLGKPGGRQPHMGHVSHVTSVPVGPCAPPQEWGTVPKVPPIPPTPNQGAPRAGDTPGSGAVSPRGTSRATTRTQDTLSTPHPVCPPPQNNCHSVGWGQAFPERGEPSSQGGGSPTSLGWGVDKRGRGWVAPGTRMLSRWALVLAVLGGACALPAPAPLAYTQALTQAVDSYNQRPEVQNAFRLLSADPEPAPDIQLKSLQRLNFTIMETQCPGHSDARSDACEFKDDGVIKDCWAPVPQAGGRPALDVTCVDSQADPVRVKRFWPLLKMAFRTVRTGIRLFNSFRRG
ncbi:cathelicidin-3-like [Chroicocephalus ridibundus]|uniref:cathelicidin-3-like n=1 Tax=Chroicocephalus ridibundus TaxID=1192867 RepID=UPI002FDE5088